MYMEFKALDCRCLGNANSSEEMEGECRSFLQCFGKVITSTKLQCGKTKGNLEWKKQK